MYNYLAEKVQSVHDYKHYHKAPKGLLPWDVFRMATSGEAIPVSTAILIRDTYFPGESIEKLFEEAHDDSLLTLSEAGKIMRNTMPGEVMPEIAGAIYNYVKSEVENPVTYRGQLWLLGLGLAIGRAAGVKEERSRKKEASHERQDQAIV